MSEEVKIYRGKHKGRTTPLLEVGKSFCSRSGKDERNFSSSDDFITECEITDLTELTFHPKGEGVWIDLGKGDHRTSPKWISRQLKRVINCAGVEDAVGETVVNYFRELADLLAQLTPSAEGGQRDE